MSNQSPVIQTILSRRSVRTLKPTPLPRSHIEQLLKVMEAAPSAGNLQPWGFYVVTRQELKDTLCTLSFDQQAVAQAGALFVITAKPALSAEKYDELGKTLFCLQDTACAAQNLLLAAHELGYGAVWIGVVKSREISEALDLPAAETPVALVPVGIPAEEPGNYERTPWQEKTTFLD